MRLFATVMLLAATASAATISGIVSGDGGPLAGMTVAAYAAAGTPQGATSTSASGAYSLTVPAGSYRVLAYDPAGVFATSFYAGAESFDTSTVLPLTSSQSATNINFSLVRAGFAVGRVTSPSGAGLANMTVAAYNLSGTRRGFTKTDATGSYTLSLPPGTFKIAAYDDALQYATAFFDDAASFDAGMPLTIEAPQSVTANLRLPIAAAIRGLVTDRDTAAPVANARATAYAGDGSVAGAALAGADGRFAFAVRPASLRVVIDDPAGNYATDFVPGAESFSTQPALNAAAGQQVALNASLARGAHLAGRVTDLAGGAPLAGIVAAAYNADGTMRSLATTDAAGAYAIVVPGGDYRAGAYDATLVYLPQVSSATTHAVAPQTVGGLDFALVKGAHVSGRVTARDSGAPLPAITVGAYDAAGSLMASATTDAGGAYSIVLAADTVKLVAFDTAFQFATTYYLGAPSFVTLFPGEALAADFALARAGRIGGTVVDAATSAPLADIDVIAFDASFARVAETTTDATGPSASPFPPERIRSPPAIAHLTTPARRTRRRWRLPPRRTPHRSRSA